MMLIKIVIITIKKYIYIYDIQHKQKSSFDNPTNGKCENHKKNKIKKDNSVKVKPDERKECRLLT